MGVPVGQCGRRERIVAADKRHVWHPYTPMQQYLDEVDPLVIERAEGARLWDVDGRSYIDANSSWWVALLGHRHPRLTEVLRRQSERLCHVSLAGVTHEEGALLAEEVCAVAPPGLTRVLYGDNGSTAVEAAMKMALQLWYHEGRPERRRFVALDGAFHGETLGVTALGGVELFRRPFAGVVLECVHAPFPDEDGHRRAFEAMGELLAEGADTIAAVVVEPVLQGASGMRTYPPEYLARLAAACREHDVLLIVDEVFTGYGRTGPMWASSLAGIEPDIVCLAKGFSGGILPMSATLANERVFSAFLGSPERTLHYGHSYCGHPMGAAIAREVLAIYRDEQILERARPKSERIAAAFARMGAIDGVARTRSLGMMGALDLTTEGGYLGRGGWRVYDEARARGAYLRPLGDTVYVAPPLNIPDDDLTELLDIVEASVLAALGRG